MSKLTLFAAALAALFVTLPAFAGEPTQSPATYRPNEYPEPSSRASIVAAGAGVALGGYGLAFGTSYLWSDAPTAGDLRIPVAGPVLAMYHAKCGSDEPGCGTFTVVLRTIIATLSGIGQVGGLGVIAEGLFLNTGPDRSPPAPPAAALSISPMAEKSAWGLSLSGQF